MEIKRGKGRFQQTWVHVSGPGWLMLVYRVGGQMFARYKVSCEADCENVPEGHLDKFAELVKQGVSPELKSLANAIVRVQEARVSARKQQPVNPSVALIQGTDAA